MIKYRSIEDIEQDYFSLSRWLQIILFCSIEVDFSTSKNFVLFERTTQYLKISLLEEDEEEIRLFF